MVSPTYLPSHGRCKIICVLRQNVRVMSRMIGSPLDIEVEDRGLHDLACIPATAPVICVIVFESSGT